MTCAPKATRGFLDRQHSLLSQVFVVPDQTFRIINIYIYIYIYISEVVGTATTKLHNYARSE